MSKLAEQFAEMGRIARGFTPFEGRREMAIALCNAVGLRANDVTRLALTFEADGSTYIEATLFPRWGNLTEFIRRIPIFVPQPPLVPLTETIERLDVAIANVRRYA